MTKDYSENTVFIDKDKNKYLRLKKQRKTKFRKTEESTTDSNVVV